MIRYVMSSAIFMLVPAFVGCSVASAALVPYADVITASNPVGWWRLGESAGATTAINSGSAGALLNGAYTTSTKVNGPSLIASDPGNSSADLTPNAYITGTGLNSVGGGNPFVNDWTIEVWFQRDTVTQWSALFSNVIGANGAPILTFNDSSNRLGINQAGVSPVEAAFLDLGTAPGGYLGKTVYAVITKTGGNAISAATFKIYANVAGTWITGASSTGTNYWAIPQGNSYYIGRHFDAASQFHDGRIDEVAIYNRALSQAEIEFHFSPIVPEPSTFALLGLGVVGWAVKTRRRRRIAA